jgi:hypothetical protein
MRAILESASKPYEDALKTGAKPQDLLAHIVSHLDRINLSDAPEAEKQRAHDELLKFVEGKMTFQPDFHVDNGLTFDDYTPAGYVREDVNLDEWSLRSLFSQKKKPSTPRKPKMPKARVTKPTVAKPPASTAKPTPTPQPRRPLFGEREDKPLHEVFWHPGLKVFAGHVAGQPFKAKSERAFYGHLINHHQFTHQKAVDFIHAAKHGETSPSDATLPVHQNLMMAAHHLDKAREHHILGNHQTREHHLHFAGLHADAATWKTEGGAKVDHEKLKTHWATLKHHVHALDHAMREDRCHRLIAPLMESLAGVLSTLKCPPSVPGVNVAYHKPTQKFTGQFRGHPLTPANERGLLRQLRQLHGLDSQSADSMIQAFKTGSTDGTNGSPVAQHLACCGHHMSLAASAHRAGNHAEKNSHLKIASAYLDKASAHAGHTDYGQGHPLRAKIMSLHQMARGLR